MRAVSGLAKAVRPAIIAGLLALVPAFDGEAAGRQKFKPVDQAVKDPSFLAFRDAMLDAVRRRDVDFVVANASADIKLSFGGDHGSESLRRNLTGSEAWEGEAYWIELQRALELGSVRNEDGSYCTPYTFCLEVPGCPDCDPFETVIVVVPDAVARAVPDHEAEEVGRFSYDILQMDPEAETGEDWYPVLLPAGGTGFLSRAEARVPVDYRALFEKIDGRWFMTVLIAGD